MMSIAPDSDLLSVGKICELLQASPAQIERAAIKAGVQVALRLNSVPYFHDSDLAAIRDHLPRKAKP